MENMEYVGFGRRFVAYMIDWIILSIALFAIFSLISVFGLDAHRAMQDDAYAVAYGTKVIRMAVVITILYFVLMESSAKQGTIGKMLMGIKIINKNGERLSKGNAFLRYFSRALSGIILGIGFLMILFSNEKQGLHDRLAKTYVVKK